MAVFREVNRCAICGEKIEEIHKPNDGTFIGDTFIGYKEHKCRPSKLRLMKLAEEKGIHGLVAALKDPKVNDSCKDLQDFGWVRCDTDYPCYNEEVQVTDGKFTALGVYWDKTREGNFPLFNEPTWVLKGTETYRMGKIIAWTYKADLMELQECLNIKRN